MSSLQEIVQNLRTTYPNQATFIQAVDEVITSLAPLFDSSSVTSNQLARLEHLLTPERIITFKVLWSDDVGNIQHNVGYRVQFNSALGPYKGGLRFDASVNEDVLKFLGFEQTFKNALTGLPLGGGKGGSNFNPKGKSDNEIRNFCRAFMVELHRHIGIDVDVPAGDMGVGGREIGYMMGMYKELTGGRFEGVMTGKPIEIGGSIGRIEATGHGVVYFAKAMLNEIGLGLKNMKCVVSGCGNVAEHTARKLQAEEALVLTMSDRTGYIYKESGLTNNDIDVLIKHKDNGANLDSLKLDGGEFFAGTPWQNVLADTYFPCATQNEINVDDAKVMIKHAKLVVEGANMPITNEAVTVIHDAHILHAPGKASNAGGVAVSGLEMSQNASHYPWSGKRVDEELQTIMDNIHTLCVTYGREDWGVNYVKGANIAGASRVLSAMEKLGW